MVDKMQNPYITWKDVGLFLLIFFGWVASSAIQLEKYFHGMAGWSILAGALGVVAVLVGIKRLLSRGDSQIHWLWMAAFWLVMVGIYTVLYPIAHLHAHSRGSDSEDALRLATTEMLRGDFPYYLRTYLGDPITPMPGSLLLATPFLLMGRVSLQNPFWLAAFVVLCARYFRFRATALAYLLVVVLGSAITLDDFVVGADFSINTFYICVAVVLFLGSFKKNPLGAPHLLAAIFLGIALSSRTLYVVLLPLLMAYLLQSGRGWVSALRSFALPIATAAAITVPFYLYDPARFTPLHVAGKLNFLSLQNQHILLVLLPAIALLISCTGFFLKLEMPRFFLIAGLASAVILLPPGLLLCFKTHFSEDGLFLLDYGEAAAILLGLWAFHEFEDSFPSGEKTRKRLPVGVLQG